MKRRRLMFLINTARTLILRRADQALLSELGLTATQLGALFAITAHEGCLLKELADALHLAPSAITGLVARMEKLELVSRQRCPKDGRAFRIHSTTSGRALRQRAIPMIKTLTGTLEADFSPEELDVVERFLRTTIDRLSDPSPNPDDGATTHEPH